MARPTKMQMDIAAAWLGANQGEIEEYEACKAVANWLEDLIMLDHIRQLAGENNVPYGKLKSKLLKKINKQNDGRL